MGSYLKMKFKLMSSSQFQNLRKQLLNNAKRRVKNKSKKKVKRPNKGQEKRCVDNFRHLGISELETPLGYVDLVTKEYAIEFKVYTGAKAALGQILCYSHFIKPKRKLMIVLFGKGINSWKGFIPFERVCALYDVEVFKLSHSTKYKGLREKLGEQII